MNAWGAILGGEERLLIPRKIICYLFLLSTSGRLKGPACRITLPMFSNKPERKEKSIDLMLFDCSAFKGGECRKSALRDVTKGTYHSH